jgi:hypothetical protein
MDDERGSETAEQLLSLARAHEYEVTNAQLARWHRAGLLPRPQRRFLGRPEGSRSIYPAGTGRLLLALCAIRTRERRLPLVGWQLWWNGYDVPSEQIKSFLLRFLSRYDSFARELLPAGDLSTRGLALVEALAHQRLDEKGMRRVRKRVGRRNFPSFMRLVLQLASGSFMDWADEDDPKILAGGLGVRKARRRTIAAGWSADPRPFQLWSRLSDPARLRKRLSALPAHELARGRDELRTLLTTTALVGMGFKAAQDLDITKPLIQIAFMLAWIASLPSEGGRET